MSILRFITQEEINALDGNPRARFMTLVQLAQNRLAELSSLLNPTDEAEWEEREELRHSFVNVVIAAAKKFEIEPFHSMIVPRVSDFKRSSDFREFQADLDHYMTQLMLDASDRNERDSVAILPESKERIRSYVRALRKCLEDANMQSSKRESLLEKLDEFERELENRRLSLLAVTYMTFTLLALPGGVWQSGEIATKLVTNIMQVVAEAKAAEEETPGLSGPQEMKALSPPRPESQQKSISRTAIDDDIPF